MKMEQRTDEIAHKMEEMAGQIAMVRKELIRQRAQIAAV